MTAQVSNVSPYYANLCKKSLTFRAAPELSLKRVDREARLRGSFESESSGGERR
jgi:hypothetical protein